MGCANIIINNQGIHYIDSKSVTVSDTAVNFSFGFRDIKPIGLLALRITNTIPADAADTLPITITLNGTSRPLTAFGGSAVTVADLNGTGVILVIRDRINDILQIISPSLG